MTYCLGREFNQHAAEATSWWFVLFCFFPFFFLLSWTFFANFSAWLGFSLLRHACAIMVSNVSTKRFPQSTLCLLPSLQFLYYVEPIYLLKCLQALLFCMLLRDRGSFLLIFISPVPWKVLGTSGSFINVFGDLSTLVRGGNPKGKDMIWQWPGSHVTLCFLSSLGSLITLMMNKSAWFSC